MQPFIDSTPLLPLLADAALKGIVLLAAISLSMLPLRRASADARHLAWLCGIVGLLILPIFAALLPDWRVLPAWAILARPHPIREAMSLERLAPAGTNHEQNLDAVPVRADETLTSAAPIASPNPRQPKAVAPVSHTNHWLVFAWIAGAALCGARLLVGHCRLHLATRRAEPLASGALMDALRSAAATLGLRRHVCLLIDPRRTIPLAWGVWQPRLILPAEAATWDAERCRAVFLHELAHIKRGDLLVLLLTQVACIIHWFNPFVWFAAWRLHVERERACDDLVLATGVKASAYAEHLLHVATQLEACAPNGSLAMARPSRLEGRLLALFNGEINRSAATARIVALVVLALTVLLVPLAMLRGADEKNREAAEQPREPGREIPVPQVPSPELSAAPAVGEPAISSPKKTEEKATLSERLLEAIDSRVRTTPTDEPEKTNAPREESARELDLLNREIELASEQLQRASKGYEQGQTSIDRVMQQQRELSLLKIEQAKIKNDFAALEKAIREQMELVAHLRTAQEKRMEVGVDSGDSILSLERELLRLERELAAANAEKRGARRSVPGAEPPTAENPRNEELQKAQSQLDSMFSRGLGESHPAVKAVRERFDQLAVIASSAANGAARSARRREIAISAPKPGIVQQVLVREGDKVKSGDRLLVFDERQAKVKLETARAQLEAAKAGLKLEEIAVQGASDELERTKEIVAQRLISQAEATTKQRAYQAAQAGLAKSAAEFAVVEQQMRQAELELELLAILSPRAGTILRVNVLEGEHTSPANDPLIVIGD